MSDEGTAAAPEAAKANQTDPVIRQYREQISDNDLRILEAINKRIKLVQKLKDYKESQDIDFVDTAQENWVLTYLARSNRGPLSNDALQQIFAQLLQITKDEIARIESGR